MEIFILLMITMQEQNVMEMLALAVCLTSIGNVIIQNGAVLVDCLCICFYLLPIRFIDTVFEYFLNFPTLIQRFVNCLCFALNSFLCADYLIVNVGDNTFNLLLQ